MKIDNKCKMDNNNNYGSPYAPSTYSTSFQSQPYGASTGMSETYTSNSTYSSQPVEPIPIVPVEVPVYCSHKMYYYLVQQIQTANPWLIHLVLVLSQLLSLQNLFRHILLLCQNRILTLHILRTIQPYILQE